MRVVIAGNGLAGIITAKTIREQNPDVSIEIFADEKYHYYPRPNLIEYVAGNISYARLFAFKEDWYREKNINVHLNVPIKGIAADKNKVYPASGKEEPFDALLLATGAHCFLPPFKGADKKGLFTLRTLEDAEKLIAYAKEHTKVVIVGGGLLGLEIARALKTRGAEVRVVEYFSHLLPRQLDEPAASLLEDLIEEMGIKVHLGKSTEEILGRESVSGLRFKDGSRFEAETVIVAAGIRSNIALPREAGIEVDKGIVVDDFLQTNRSRIYAAGDIAQHKGRLYGIIPATFEQARIAAVNILGGKTKYDKTVPSNTLKVVGLDVTSIGLVSPEEPGYEEFRKTDREKGIYKKIVIRDDIVAGAIWIGTKKGVAEISRCITQKIKVKKNKESLLEEDFDFSTL
ncbi:MAG: NAD(P)/FAD-dependent oxidoreductase [Candidatus Aminicenantes bacterium]|nr:NAD(P)/FAD-dependent oxidoreductase [Candidatus Aminicenantes bacterium]